MARNDRRNGARRFVSPRFALASPRRVTKNAQRFVYNDYLQIYNFDSTTTTSDYNYFIWDPTEPIATRPLVWERGTSTAYYTHDGNKNVSEVIASDCALAAHYEYAPFGAVIIQRGEFAAANLWRFSSEYADDELGCDYYNYREYEPVTGRWMQRDHIEEIGGACLYCFLFNKCENGTDWCGMKRSMRSFAQYDFNKDKCELNVTLRWWVHFNYRFMDVVLENWTEHEKSKWKADAKSSIEGYFNSLPFRCYNEKCCSDGVRVNVMVQFVERSFIERLFRLDPDYDSLVVVTKYIIRSHVNPDSGRLDCEQGDVSLGVSGRQIVIVHEVGHLLGLNHPGAYTQEKENSKADYKATYNGLPGKYNLMGSGMALHYDDFNRAFCDHIK